MTTRGMKEPEMEMIAEWLIKGVEIAKRIQGTAGKMLKDFLPALYADEETKKIAQEVIELTQKFSIPGV
jgi:glycine/serine hydroxymethyltransferase